MSQCLRALADVHDEYLRDASQCLTAAEVLEREGRESWIARAVIHQLGFEAAWDALDDDDLGGELGVMSFEC